MEGYTKNELLIALKAECEWVRENESKYDATVLKRHGIELIENLRDTSQGRGEWYEVGPLLLACSNCGRAIGCPMSNAPKFCENCGSNMNGDEDPDEQQDEELEAWLNE